MPISALMGLSCIFTGKGTIDLCKYCFNRELLMLLVGVKGTLLWPVIVRSCLVPDWELLNWVKALRGSTVSVISSKTCTDLK